MTQPYSNDLRERVAAPVAAGQSCRVVEPHRTFTVERIDQTSHLTLHRLEDELAARCDRLPQCHLAIHAP